MRLACASCGRCATRFATPKGSGAASRPARQHDSQRRAHAASALAQERAERGISIAKQGLVVGSSHAHQGAGGVTAPRRIVSTPTGLARRVRPPGRTRTDNKPEPQAKCTSRLAKRIDFSIQNEFVASASRQPRRSLHAHNRRDLARRSALSKPLDPPPHPFGCHEARRAGRSGPASGVEGPGARSYPKGSEHARPLNDAPKQGAANEREGCVSTNVRKFPVGFA